jgi:hypothetical protein
MATTLIVVGILMLMAAYALQVSESRFLFNEIFTKAMRQRKSELEKKSDLTKDEEMELDGLLTNERITREYIYYCKR